MKSPVISQPEGQLTLSFESGLADRHTSLRDCVAACIYRYGLTNAAIELDKAPGNLSVELSAEPARNFSVDSLERYIGKTGDTTPIYYLIDRFLNDKAKSQDAAMAQLAPLLKQLAPLMKQAGL